MSKVVDVKPGHRRAAVGVVGCLLLGGAFGTAPHQAGAHSVTAQESPPAASSSSLSFRTLDLSGEPGHDATDVPSARLLRVKGTTLHLPKLETYLVQEGDTLSEIASAYDTDTATIEALNEDLNPDVIAPGETLKVIKAFHGLTYTVQDGDTLDGVARMHGIAADDVRQANGLQVDAGLREGETLFLPGARQRSRMVVSRGGVSRTESRAVAVASETRAVVAQVAPAPQAAHPVPVPAAPPAPSPAAAAPPAAKPAPGAGWVWPITGGEESSEFGWRSDIGDFHEGLDIAVPAGTVGVASRGGTVIEAGWDGGYGLCMIIDHGDGTKSRYAHASALLATVGDVVKQGQAIIKVGSTGHSTGNHLHFEIIVNGKPQNPRNFLP